MRILLLLAAIITLCMWCTANHPPSNDSANGACKDTAFAGGQKKRCIQDYMKREKARLERLAR